MEFWEWYPFVNVVCGFLAYVITKGRYKNRSKGAVFCGWGYKTEHEIRSWGAAILGPAGLFPVVVISLIIRGKLYWCLKISPGLKRGCGERT